MHGPGDLFRRSAGKNWPRVFENGGGVRYVCRMCEFRLKNYDRIKVR